MDDVDLTKAVAITLLSRSGPYTFETWVESGDDGSLVVERPPRIARVQRRRYTRRPASLPASVKGYLREELPDDAVINDLSGGGATITNPHGVFDVGDILDVSFRIGSRAYSLTGRVVRASTEAKHLHLRFEAMKDQQRQEIAAAVSLVELQ